MTANVISIPRAALHEQVAMRLRQMLVENRIAPGAHLFPQYAARGFSALISNTMNRPLGIKYGVDALRSMTIATNRDKEKDLPGLQKILAGIDLAQKMHHSHKTAPAYVRNFAPDEAGAPPKKRAGRPKKTAPVVAPPPPVKRGRGRPKKS